MLHIICNILYYMLHIIWYILYVPFDVDVTVEKIQAWESEH